MEAVASVKLTWKEGLVMAAWLRCKGEMVNPRQPTEIKASCRIEKDEKRIWSIMFMS